MIPKRQHLEAFVAALVDERLEYHDHQLPPVDHNFLITELTEFVFHSVDKFIRGSKEHNPDNNESFVMDCDHSRERRMEVYDFFFYNQAEEYKKKLTSSTCKDTQNSHASTSPESNTPTTNYSSPRPKAHGLDQVAE